MSEAQYTIPCGHKMPPVDNSCGLNGLCQTCQVVRYLREALMGHLEYETLYPIPLIKPTVEEAEKYMAMIERSVNALSRVQEVTLP